MNILQNFEIGSLVRFNRTDYVSSEHKKWIGLICDVEINSINYGFTGIDAREVQFCKIMWFHSTILHKVPAWDLELATIEE